MSSGQNLYIARNMNVAPSPTRRLAELSGLGDNRPDIDLPRYTSFLERYAKTAHPNLGGSVSSTPLEGETVIGNLVFKPETRNLAKAQHLDRTRQQLNDRLAALQEQTAKMKEKARAVQERSTRRVVGRLAKRRGDGVSRYFPPIDYLQKELESLREDLHSAIGWNFNLRRQVETIRFEHNLFHSSEDTWSNNSTEEDPIKERAFETLRERNQDLEMSLEHVAYLLERGYEVRQEINQRYTIHSEDVDPPVKPPRQYLLRAIEREGSISTLDLDEDIIHTPEEEDDVEESDDSAPLYTPDSTPEDTPEESTNHDLSTEVEDENNMPEDEAIIYRSLALRRYKGEQAELRVANGNEAINATPDTVRNQRRERTDQPRDISNMDPRARSLVRAANVSISRIRGFSTRAANLLMLL
ncbi:hypothetical protein Vi05172_g1756 [Venturia inaequalis]|nr:hypothetical protein Vi05172_g1756 [Venturia inaequalis]